MNKLVQIAFLTSLISWSLQCYQYTFINKTDEYYDIEIHLTCVGKNLLKGRLEPQVDVKKPTTLTLKGPKLCCFNLIKIHPQGSKESMYLDLNYEAPCSDPKLTITKTPGKNTRFTSDVELRRGYFINGDAYYRWKK